jgi:hypothetical protein
MDEELLSLWRSLNKNEVRYILVGGFAVNLHGFSRITADVDIWLEDTLSNRKKFRQALKELEFGDYKEIETMPFVPGWSGFLLHSGFELDVMTFLKSFPAEKFSSCFEMAPEVKVHDVPIKFLHINHLIQEKQTLARPKDLLDIEEMKRIKESGDN